MRILFTSDLHGHIGAFTRFSELLSNNEYDVGVISGDLMTYHPDKDHIENITRKILESAGKTVFFIMGNDDGILEHDWSDSNFLRNPDLKRIPYGEHNFVGYQYTNPLVGGPFEKTEEEQLADLPRLQELVDSDTILITHGPAFGVLDTKEGIPHIGSRILSRLIETNKPAYHLFGHAHKSAGVAGCSINGAYPEIRKFVVIDTCHNSVEYIE